MDVRDAVSLTAASIRTHKLRSVLAATGVVLGIGSVIGVVTMGAGFQEALLGSFTGEFSADILSVGLERAGVSQNNGPPVAPNVFAFTDRDLGVISNLPSVTEVGAITPVPQAMVRADGKDIPGVIVNARSSTFQFAPVEVGHAATAEREAVISNLTSQHLRVSLNRSDIVGMPLSVAWPNPAGGTQNATVTIVGIEKSSQFIQFETMTVGASFAPTTTFADGSSGHAWQSLSVRANSATQLDGVKSAVKSYLEEKSDAKDRKGDALVFRFTTQSDVIKIISTAIAGFTAFIGALGAVSLLVGLVGIVNIMLVSVQERTREIGVMKATGASRGEVLLVFLVESVAICIVGAILGVGLGMLMGFGLDVLISSFGPNGRLVVHFVFVPSWYVIAVVLGIVVGLVAGVYPAWRAAKVSPVEALRYE